MFRFATRSFLLFSPIIGLFVSAQAGTPPLVNEVLVNPNGVDSNCEYAEIIGDVSGTLNNIYYVSIEGDSTSTVGAFDRVVDLSASTLGSNGLLVITNDTAGDCTRTYNTPTTTRVQVTNFSMENGTNSWALILSPTTAIVEGTDYDTNNDGTLDALPGDAVILDGLGFDDGGATDTTYGAALPPTAGGGADMATRFPGNTDATSVAAWYYGDMDGTSTSTMYDLTQVSANFPSGGELTPGAANVGGGPTPQAPNVDFDGDGISDYSIVRDTSSAFSSRTRSTFGSGSVREKMRALAEYKANGKIDSVGAGPGSSNVWFNYSTDTGGVTVSGFGEATTDFLVPEDYDGDGKDDIAVWRSTGATSASFFILQSSDGMMIESAFGQEGDDPTVTGDYDGDGTADVAVFRCPALGAGDGQCFYYYRGSNNNPGGSITFVPWGFGETFDFFANPGDFDGDGKYDFCLQRAAPGNPAQGQFVLLNSSDSSFQFINWGGPNDFIVPGDYDGDGRSDFMVRRSGSNPFQWYLLESDGGGTGASPIFWGIPGDEFAPGDYDGDGKTDVAVRRPDPVAANNLFYVLRSTGGFSGFQWGLESDFASAGWNVH